MRGKDWSEKTYPHLDDTKFPDLPTVDAYKYRNNVPYEEYTDSVKIKMMNVSWCGDYDNTVYFETKQERDAWFESQTGQVMELPTMFRLYPSGTIKVPCTIDEAMNYNYVMIDFGKTLYQTELSDNHIMYYFINDVSQKSPNATELTLVLDFWTTFINDMDIEYVSLMRGHAPMVATPADVYLSNPIDNCEFLLTPDVNFGKFQRVETTESVIFNEESSEMTVGFLTNASMQMGHENKTRVWTADAGYEYIPTFAFEYSQAFSCIDTFVLDNISYWKSFRENVTARCPQFWETVKGMFIIPKKLIQESNYTTGRQFMFCGIPCHHVETDGDKLIEVVEFTKDKFNFPEQFADIAKLYTFPYAAVEVNDFKGNSMLIKIEDTSGSIEVHTIMCDMYPFLNIEAYMTGVGSSQKYTIKFKNSYDNKMMIGGHEYDFSTKWFIPVFAVQLTVEDNWYLNGKIDADAAKNNALDAAKVDRFNHWDNINSNSALITRVEVPLVKKMYEYNAESAYYAMAKALVAGSTYQDLDNTATIQGTSVGLAGGLISGGLNGGITGAASAGANGVTNAWQSAFIVNKNTDCTLYGNGLEGAYFNKMYGGYTPASTPGYSVAGLGYNNPFSSAGLNGRYITGTKTGIEGQRLDQNVNAMETRLGVTRERDREITNNNYSLIVGGTISYHNSAWDDTDTDSVYGNALRAYDAHFKQKMLINPPEFGQLTGTPDIISKPFGLRYNFITQSKNAIRQTGEQFLRYGYFLNMEWKITTFNLMSMFTYWHCDRVYCNDNGVFEGAQDFIKTILQRGTTVWRRPEDIGVKSIYENKIPTE